MAVKLEPSAIDAHMQALAGWSRQGDNIHKQFTFSAFPSAIQFVAQVALLAEAAKHHPDIDIRYNKVRLSLSTHDVGGLSDKDFALALQIDGLLS